MKLGLGHHHTVQVGLGSRPIRDLFGVQSGMQRLSSPIGIFRCIPQSIFPFSSNVADRTDDCSVYLTDTFREVICHQEELLSVLVEHGDRELDLHRVKVALKERFIDGKGLISRNSRQNRHNRRYLLPNCYQRLQPSTKWATGLAVRDQPKSLLQISLIGTALELLCIIGLGEKLAPSRNLFPCGKVRDVPKMTSDFGAMSLPSSRAPHNGAASQSQV
jgi:hypothetical protein